MSGSTGSLTLAARRTGSRTILERIRYDGISRCSRSFVRGDAALVVLSQLGPGVVRGDRVAAKGQLHAGAHVIVTNQAATRLMGGVWASEAQAEWLLEDAAVLELLGEPLVANAGARYRSSTAVELRAGAFVLVSELACVPRDAAVRLRTVVRRFGRELFYDAFEPAAAAPQTVGTLALVGIEAARAAPLVAALDRAADSFGVGLRIGVGALGSGAFVRVLGDGVWEVREALVELRRAAWAAL